MRAAAVLIGLAGCAEPAIEVTLKLPTAATIPATFDLKCVTAVDMVAHADDTTQTDIGWLYSDGKLPPCVDLDEPPGNFTDIRNAMRGQFDIPLPLEGLLAIQVRGRTGTCADQPPFHEAIFYGGAPYRDGESVTVPLVANISCNPRKDYEVRPVDLLELTATKTCPGPVTDGSIFSGNIRPTLLAPAMSPIMFEGGTSEMPPVNGTAVVSSFGNLGTTSCVAVGFETTSRAGVTCINAGAPTVCGELNEIEVPTAPDAFLDASVDGTLEDQFGPPTFVGVWETAPAKLPLAGATVTLSEPSRGEVQFLDVAASRFTARTGPTGPSGLFAVYSDQLQEITVSAPGHGPRKLLVGGGMALVVLSRI